MNVAHGLIAVGALVYLIVALILFGDIWSDVLHFIGAAMLLVLFFVGVFLVGAQL